MVYEPAEDSWLLEGVVKSHARGRTIDVGTGTGVQALAALQKTENVIAVDIKARAVEHAQKAGVHALQSDLFDAVDGLFDTIICNTPYLPDEGSEDAALDGGKKGFEWTLRFLEQAINHLNRHGQILFLISSHTNPGVVEKWMAENCLAYEILAKQTIFFEDLFVYKATFTLPDHADAKFVARGKRSIVYRSGDLAIKKSDPAIASREATMLEAVNKLGVGPTFHHKSADCVFMDFIDGVPIGKWLESATQEQIKEILSKSMEQCRLMDEAGIDKRELTNPYKHIIVTNNKPVMIDFERSRFSENPHCVSQFREYARRHGVDL